MKLNLENLTAPEHGAQRRLLILAATWLSLIGLVQWYARSRSLGIADTLEQLALLMAMSWYGPLLFLLAAALSPLVLVPAALLGLVAGAVFGPVTGLLYTLAGCNLSALICYGVGSSLGQPARERLLGGSSLIGRYCSWLHRNSFLAVLLLRLGFLPYDLVSYTAGALHIGWLRFLLANTLGCLPGAVVLVAFGASFQHLQLPTRFAPGWLAAVAILMAALSFGIAWFLRKRGCES
jgi:uncharacterized membrane protein YdjX (TVP38/TMEM64 family)